MRFRWDYIVVVGQVFVSTRTQMKDPVLSRICVLCNSSSLEHDHEIELIETKMTTNDINNNDNSK